MARCERIADSWQVVVCDSGGRIAGAGVLLSDRLVLTCAHVVEAAGGAASREPDDPGPGLRVESVLCPQRWSRPAQVVPGCWVSRRDTQRGDVALLSLSAPVTCHPGARLRRAPVRDVAVRMRGFPYGDSTGTAAEGRLVGDARHGEWVEIHARGDDRAPWVARGFSGAGVVSAASGDVIGIIMAVREAGDGVAAFMMPVETVIRHLPRVCRFTDGGSASDPSFSQPPGDLAIATAGAAGGAVAEVALRQEVGRLFTGVWSGTAVITGGDPDTATPWLARLVTSSDPGARPSIPDEAIARVPPGATLGMGAIDLAVDAGGRDVEWVRRRITERFGLPGSDCAAVVSALLRHQPRPTLVIDRVDSARDPAGLIAELVGPLAARARRRGVRLVLGFTGQPPAGLRHEISLGPEPLAGTARAPAWPDLVRSAISELADAEQALATRYAEVSARVAGASVPPPGIAARLRVRFAVVTAVTAGPPGAELALIGERAEAALADAARRDARLHELRRTHDRLQLTLAVCRKRAGEGSGAGDRRLGELYGAARETLAVRPCDLAAAQAAVDAYVDALHRRETPGPGWGA